MILKFIRFCCYQENYFFMFYMKRGKKCVLCNILWTWSFHNHFKYIIAFLCYCYKVSFFEYLSFPFFASITWKCNNFINYLLLKIRLCMNWYGACVILSCGTVVPPPQFWLCKLKLVEDTVCLNSDYQLTQHTFRGIHKQAKMTWWNKLDCILLCCTSAMAYCNNCICKTGIKWGL